MWFAAIVVGLAIAIVVLTPGGPQRLWGSLLSVWMLLAGVGLQLVLAFIDLPDERIDDLGFGLLMVSYALILAFCFVNLRRQGLWLVAVGVALNTVVVGLNEGMPTADSERTTASGRTVDVPIERTVKQRPESDDDIVGFLGDVIEIPGPIDSRISIGDILIAAGGLYACFRLSRRPAGAAPDAPAATSAPLGPETDFAAFWDIDPTLDDMPVALNGSDEDDDAVFDPAVLAGTPGHEPIANVLEHEADDDRDGEPADVELIDSEILETGIVDTGIVDESDPGPDLGADLGLAAMKLDWDDDELERKLAAGESRALVSEPEQVVVSNPAKRASAPPPPPPPPQASPPPPPPPEPEPVTATDEPPEPVVDPTPTPPPISWREPGADPEPAVTAEPAPTRPDPAPVTPAAYVRRSEPETPDQREAPDDPLAVELEKLFARLSRGIELEE